MYGEQALNAQRVQHKTFDESDFDRPTQRRRRRWLVWLLVLGASLAAALAVAL